MSYRDMTFCPFHATCADGKSCPRALTDEVRERARKWWGGDDAPISEWAEPPRCHKPPEMAGNPPQNAEPAAEGGLEKLVHGNA